MQTTSPESVGLSSRRLERIHAAMQRYVGEGKTAGVLTMVARGGKLAFCDAVGLMNIKARAPMADDAIFRIYSMTKPITSVAALILLEEGLFRLTDPVSDTIPARKGLKVLKFGSGGQMGLEDARREITIRDLFTHSAGFSYGFNDNDYLDELYRKQLWPKIDADDASLETLIGCLAEQPLAFQPGTAFRYSLSIDVLGRLVEVVSGRPLDAFFRERIFEPLGMDDTAFWVPPEKVSRFALNYGPDEKRPGKLKDIDPLRKSGYLRQGSFFSGGGGLVSTAHDYLRFCQMLLNGGALDGERILGRKTVELLRANHLPEGVYEDENRAYGFGLGGNVLIHAGRAPVMGTPGSWGWGGAAGTKFWIDWQEQLIGLLMQQIMPDTEPIGNTFKNLVYGALVDEG